KAYNLLATLGTAMLLGEEEEEAMMQLSKMKAAQGRFETIEHGGIMAIVDYAHTPDALENVLKTMRGIRTGGEQVITVVGCGGNHDKEKRPIMAHIAAQISDKVILTSDNPRNESPGDILKDMEAGINPVALKKVLTISDRREAIKTACSMASKGDIILIAGRSE